jgi:hypothetical protein
MVMTRARREQILERTLTIAHAYFHPHNDTAYLLDVAARFLMRRDYEMMIEAIHLFQLQNRFEGLELDLLSDILVQAYELADGTPEEEELNEEYSSCEEEEPCED